MGKMRNTYKSLVVKPEGKRPLERPRHRWEDNTEIVFREIELEDVDLIHLAQDRGLWLPLVNTVMNLRVP
jgi:hypothetical protein